MLCCSKPAALGRGSNCNNTTSCQHFSKRNQNLTRPMTLLILCLGAFVFGHQIVTLKLHPSVILLLLLLLLLSFSVRPSPAFTFLRALWNRTADLVELIIDDLHAHSRARRPARMMRVWLQMFNERRDAQQKRWTSFVDIHFPGPGVNLVGAPSGFYL